MLRLACAIKAEILKSMITWTNGLPWSNCTKRDNFAPQRWKVWIVFSLCPCSDYWWEFCLFQVISFGRNIDLSPFLLFSGSSFQRWHCNISHHSNWRTEFGFPTTTGNVRMAFAQLWRKNQKLQDRKCKKKLENDHERLISLASFKLRVSLWDKAQTFPRIHTTHQNKG